MARESLPWPTPWRAAGVRRLVRPAFVLFGLVAGLAACGASPVAPAATSTAVEQPAPHSVWVVQHGLHAGLVLRARDVSEASFPARADFPDADYLEVGWGDLAYYMAAEPGAWLGLQALAWPTPGVLHVVALDAAPERFFPGAEVLEIGVAPAGLPALLAYLRQSHAFDAAGQPVRLGPGLYGDSRFYASREQFHLFKTCNVWVAMALQAAGVSVTPALTLTSGQLMVQLRPLAKSTR